LRSRANTNRAGASRGSKMPGVKIITVILLIPVLLSASACRGHYAMHPEALNRADSAAYDTLLMAALSGEREARGIDHRYRLTKRTRSR